MTQDANDNRIAALLHILGANADHPVIAKLDPETADQVKQGLSRAESLEQEDLEAVLDDFEKFYRFAVDTLNLSESLPLPDAAMRESVNSSGDNGSGGQGGTELHVYEPTGDALEELRKLEPAQIAGALAEEHPRTMAIVLSQLDKESAADVLDLIPQELQTQVLLLLKQDLSGSPEMIDRVLKTTVRKGIEIECDEPKTEDADQRLVDTLRALPKKTRNRLMEEIKDRDQETVDRIQEMLFLFDDILLYDSRSVQKILGGIQTDVLVVAMQGASKDICDAVFENLSKRAGEVLKEEMSYRQKSTEDEVEAARKEIAATIGRLDQDGELNLK